MNQANIPAFVSYVTAYLQENRHQAFLVGGCVRDLLQGNTPKDWDIATSAHPEEVVKLFSHLKTVYENNFGTVTVINKKESDTSVSGETPQYEEVQITTFRSEVGYTDKRRPDNVTYETSLEKDLERRDFTMNAIAFDINKGQIIDPYNGQKDIKDKTIRCVLDPSRRFSEDALRMLRAVRFSTVLNFEIEAQTFLALIEHAPLITQVSEERIRDEFVKIISSTNPAYGIDMLERVKMLEHIIPELQEGIGCEQKGAHIYDVYSHLLHALNHAADKNFSLEVRLAALFHDIGKPQTRRYDRNKDKYTFFGHEVVGARMTKKILERLKFSRETTNLIVSLVRNHMFFSDTEKITLSAVRRIIQSVGKDNIWLLMQVRECDRVGMKKAEAPFRLRKYHAMIEEALRDPISVGQLKINGTYLMKKLAIPPGPKIGWILHALLEEALEDPTINTEEMLHAKAKALYDLPDEELQKRGEAGKHKKETADEEEIEKLYKKHRV